MIGVEVLYRAASFMFLGTVVGCLNADSHDREFFEKLGQPFSRGDRREVAPVGNRTIQASNIIDIARGRQFWSFQPLDHHHPPEVTHQDWVRTPIDHFVLKPQEQNGITPGRIANRHTLIRRAYIDLIGLPPAPAEVESFVGEMSSQAYEQLIDRLLDSPRYGERWTRHWLDLVRFAESNGFEKDEDRSVAYHYRDFVIKAFNQDMPYDRFVKLQIAGDLLDPDDALAHVATGFLVAGVQNVIQTVKEFERDRYDKLDDMVSTVSTAMLALTVGCARCHDHKYDPIPQRDYYQFLASFGRTTSREVEMQLGDSIAKVYVAGETDGESRNVNQNLSITSDVYFLARGDVNMKEELVTQSFPQVLMRGGKQEHNWRDELLEGNENVSPRVVLANWITDVDHGAGNLLARVIVNRIWQHHMGTGLVSTSSDFGSRGQRPTHPELLDWLALELIRNRWRIKPMHRLIMTSSVYMQTHRNDIEVAKIDPDNRFLWQRPLRRLEAEVIRDAGLAVSGTFDCTMYGPGTLEEDSRRRSIYLTVKRTKLIPMLQLFDAPDALQGIGRRQATTISPQALLMLNNEHVRRVARAFAHRIDPNGTRITDEIVNAGFMIALTRSPSDFERQHMREFLQHQMESYESNGVSIAARAGAVTDFCQLLICLNEFVYVE